MAVTSKGSYIYTKKGEKILSAINKDNILLLQIPNNCFLHFKEPNDKLIQFVNKSDLLIHDSHFTVEDLLNHKGWGHSSWAQEVKMAQKSNSKQLALYHYSPNYNDKQIETIESDAKKAFNKTIAAKQGLVIYL